METIRKAWKKVRGGLSKAVGAPRAGLAKLTEAPRARISTLRERAREHPTLAVGIVGGVLVGIAWIAWAIYVAANNGANAGLGVLITWPVLIGALALIAAPFVLTGMLVQRHRAASEPAIAGGPSVAEEPADKSDDKQADTKAESEDGDAKAESEADGGESEEDSDDAEGSEETAAKSA